MMKTTSCIEDWVLQAYIDGELDSDKLKMVENHLKQCPSCTNRLEQRQQKVLDVLNSLDLLEQRAMLTPKIKSISTLKIVSIAASLTILIGLFTLIDFGNSSGDTIEQQCQWVEIDESNFYPEFESPNRLYQMRAIAIAEVDNEGNEVKHYLVKQCNEPDKQN